MDLYPNRSATLGLMEAFDKTKERRELAMRILIANYPSPGLSDLTHAVIAQDAVAMADALLAELAK